MYHVHYFPRALCLPGTHPYPGDARLKSPLSGSMLGLLWTLLNPLLHMGIYVLVFSVYLRVQMDLYVVFLLCGLLPWIWFSSSLLMGASAIIEGGSLLKKVFFPPQILPTATVTANFVNFLLGIPILCVFLLLYDVKQGWTLCLLPLIMVCQFAFTLGLTLLISAASVHYRDIPHILGHLLTFWFFLSPIVYKSTQVPEQFRALLSLNPLTLFVVAYQNILLYNTAPTWAAFAAMFCVSAFALLSGVLVFTHFRWSFAEEV
jgi:lipopolysaccharide transport system permease protein